jgi:hypothetical protein
MNDLSESDAHDLELLESDFVKGIWTAGNTGFPALVGGKCDTACGPRSADPCVRECDGQEGSPLHPNSGARWP